jgi:hypothetical protein
VQSRYSSRRSRESKYLGLRHGDVFPSRKGRRGSINLLFFPGSPWGAVRAHLSSACHLGMYPIGSASSVHRERQRLLLPPAVSMVFKSMKRNPLSAKPRAKMAEVPWYLVLRAPGVWAVALFNKECHLFATVAGEEFWLWRSRPFRAPPKASLAYCALLKRNPKLPVGSGLPAANQINALAHGNGKMRSQSRLSMCFPSHLPFLYIYRLFPLVFPHYPSHCPSQYPFHYPSHYSSHYSPHLSSAKPRLLRRKDTTRI